eukprot:Skav226450  [mRNA]  locus=scaffold3855:96208:102203:+ [translate_table: standard]
MGKTSYPRDHQEHIQEPRPDKCGQWEEGNEEAQCRNPLRLVAYAGALGEPEDFCMAQGEKAAEDEQRGGSAPPARGPKILGGKCPYEILRIAHDVSFSQLRHAYKQRALETHPDKGGSDEMFKEVNTAFEFLSKKSNKPCDVAQEEQPAQTTDVAKSFLAQLLLKHLPFEAVKVIDRHVVENLREHLEELLKQGATNTKSGGTSDDVGAAILVRFGFSRRKHMWA